METSQRRLKIVNWKETFMKFLKLTGEQTNDWYPELWESYGITEAQAKNILEEYEKYHHD